MNCDDMLRHLSDYIDDCLSDELTEAMRHHLSCCPNCRIVLDSTQKMILLYKSAGNPAIPISRRTDLYDRLEHALKAGKKCD